MRQWFCWASRETPNRTHCRTHHAIRKRHYVFQKHIAQPLKPLKATLRFPKATVEPLLGKKVRCYCRYGPFGKATPSPSESLRATEKAQKSNKKQQTATTSQFGPLKSHVRVTGGRALARSRVTGVRWFHVGGGSARASFLVARVPW